MFCLVILALYLIALSALMNKPLNPNSDLAEISIDNFVDNPNTRLAVVGKGASYHLIKASNKAIDTIFYVCLFQNCHMSWVSDI